MHTQTRTCTETHTHTRTRTETHTPSTRLVTRAPFLNIFPLFASTPLLCRLCGCDGGKSVCLSLPLRAGRRPSDCEAAMATSCFFLSASPLPLCLCKAALEADERRFLPRRRETTKDRVAVAAPERLCRTGKPRSFVCLNFLSPAPPVS